MTDQHGSDPELSSNDPDLTDEHDYYQPLIASFTNDGYPFAMPPELAEMIVSLAQQLDEGLESDSPDLARLFPTAYNDDPDMDAGYQILARGQLVDQRRAAIQVVRTTARNSSLTEDELNSWMKVINDIRLVIGTHLDVGEGDHEIDPDDPDGALLEVYHVLGVVLYEFVEVLTDSLDASAD